MNLVEELFGLARDRICAAHPSLALAMDRLVPVEDPELDMPATDGRRLLCPSTWAREALQANDRREDQLLLHALAHCLLGHVLSPEPEDVSPSLWRLACDLRACQLAQALEPSALSRDGRYRELQRRFGEAGDPVAAARAMAEDAYIHERMDALVALLCPDCHDLWLSARREERQRVAGGGEGLGELWRGFARRLRSGGGRRGIGSGAGAVRQRMVLGEGQRQSFAAYLRRYTALRENPRPDPDGFRYAPYLYGLENLGAPLIEAPESREERGIASLAIAIDTSGSCARGLTQRFLELTRDILFEENLFHRRFALHIIQCDAEVRRDDAISSLREFERYIDDLVVVGGGGTDFRPALARVDALAASGALPGLKGMLYFSDGRGIFPPAPPEYEVTFVLLRHRYDAIDIPPWVRRLVIDAPRPVGGEYYEY